jgi:hypothetical protein
VKVTRLRRLPRPSFALSSSTEVSVEFDEIDPDTGLAFDEVFSFSKARTLTRCARRAKPNDAQGAWLSAASAL